jgi:hypothetical protein
LGQRTPIHRDSCPDLRRHNQLGRGAGSNSWDELWLWTTGRGCGISSPWSLPPAEGRATQNPAKPKRLSRVRHSTPLHHGDQVSGRDHWVSVRSITRRDARMSIHSGIGMRAMIRKWPHAGLAAPSWLSTASTHLTACAPTAALPHCSSRHHVRRRPLPTRAGTESVRWLSVQTAGVRRLSCLSATPGSGCRAPVPVRDTPATTAAPPRPNAPVAALPAPAPRPPDQ